MTDMFKAYQWYRHRDGGLYQFLDKIRYSDRTGEGVAYVHRWPFEVGTWIRPVEEWTEDRFAPIEISDALNIIDSMSREEGQAQVSANKKLRKGTT